LAEAEAQQRAEAERQRVLAEQRRQQLLEQDRIRKQEQLLRRTKVAQQNESARQQITRTNQQLTGVQTTNLTTNNFTIPSGKLNFSNKNETLQNGIFVSTATGVPDVSSSTLFSRQPTFTERKNIEKQKQKSGAILSVPAQYVGTIFDKQLSPELKDKAKKGGAVQQFTTFLSPKFQYDVALYNEQLRTDVKSIEKYSNRIDTARQKIISSGISESELDTGTITTSLNPAQTSALTDYNAIVGATTNTGSYRRLSGGSSSTIQDIASSDLSGTQKGIFAGTVRTVQTVPYFLPPTRVILGTDIALEGVKSFDYATTKTGKTLALGQVGLGGVLAYSGLKGLTPTSAVGSGKSRALVYGIGTTAGLVFGGLDYYSTLKQTGSQSTSIGAGIGTGGTIIAGTFAPSIYNKVKDYTAPKIDFYKNLKVVRQATKGKVSPKVTDEQLLKALKQASKIKTNINLNTIQSSMKEAKVNLASELLTRNAEYRFGKLSPIDRNFFKGQLSKSIKIKYGFYDAKTKTPSTNFYNTNTKIKTPKFSYDAPKTKGNILFEVKPKDVPKPKTTDFSSGNQRLVQVVKEVKLPTVVELQKVKLSKLQQLTLSKFATTKTKSNYQVYGIPQPELKTIQTSGQKFKTLQLQSVLQNQQQKQQDISKQSYSSGQLQQVAQKQQFKQESKQKTALVQRQRFTQSFAQPQKLRFQQRYLQKLAQPQLSSLAQSYTYATKNVPRQQQKLVNPNEGLKLPFLNLGSPTQRRPSKRFGVSIRRRGEWKPYAITGSLNQALDVGKEYTSGTLGASFKISGVGSLPKTPAGYYTKKEKGSKIFIEKRKYRLSKLGEKREIQQAKKKKKRKVKGGKKNNGKI